MYGFAFKQASKARVTPRFLPSGETPAGPRMRNGPVFAWNLLQFWFGSYRDRRSVKNAKGQHGNQAKTAMSTQKPIYYGT